MQTTVTFRHVSATEALRSHAEEKLERLGRYLNRPMEAHVILSVDKRDHRAEIQLSANGKALFADERTTDLYAAIDLCVEKLEHQVKKLNARRTNHKAIKAAEIVAQSIT